MSRGRAAAHHGAVTTGVTKCLTHRAWCPRALLLVRVTPGPGTSCHPSTEPGLWIPAGAGDLSTSPAPFLEQRVLGRPPAQPGFAFSPVSPRAEECGVTTRGALRRGACVAGTRERPRAAALFILSIFGEGNERRGTGPGPGWGADGVSAESTPRGSFPLAPRGSSAARSPKKLKA